MSKIPQVALAFWIMKICATTLGETAGDLMSMTFNLGYAVSTVILMALFFGALILQIQTLHHRPILYWTVILATSTAGTTMSDFMDRTLGLGYALGSAILVALLLGILAIWRVSEGSLSVDRIETRKGEWFYWAAILCSNTLGTALGDYLADDSGLGFLGGALVISAALAVIIGCYYGTKVSPVLLFWAAFILTRPLGATVGDLLTKTHETEDWVSARSGRRLCCLGFWRCWWWMRTARVGRLDSLRVKSAPECGTLCCRHWGGWCRARAAEG